jgi:NADPH-dependent F420 reductase
MDIAIIGSGNVGSGLASAFSRAGHNVAITSTETDVAQEVAEEVGGRAFETNAEAAQGADVIVLAVPYAGVGSILDDLGEAVDGKIIIDVTNRISREDPASVLDGSSNAEQIQAAAPTSRVVKAFNTVFAARQVDPEIDGIHLDGYVASDDDDAKETVLELVSSLGFRPIDVGGLAMARALEAMGALNISLQIRNGWSWQMGWKLLGPN